MRPATDISAMNLLKSVLSLHLVTLLTACGGGGGSAGTPVLGGSGTASVADVVVVLSSQTIANTGTETVTATITAVDSNRAAVANVPITVSVNNNGVVTPSATSTDASGTLTAVLSIGADRTNRVITVTATTGSLTKTAALSVVTAGTTVAASDLVLVLSASSIANTGTESVTATVTALDTNRNALAGAPVTISVDGSGIASASGAGTDASGRVTAAITIGADRSNRTITVTARSGSLVKTASLTVTNAAANVVASDLVLVLSSTTVSNSGNESVVATATALDANRNAISGIPVTITVDSNAVATPSGSLTDASGRLAAAVGIGADRTARIIIVTAKTGALTRNVALTVANVASAPIAADLVLVLSASTISNSGAQTVIATATALDAKRNAMAAVPVSIAVDSNAVATPNATSTDASGTVRATIGIGADRSNRVITVTATTGTLTRQLTLQVADVTVGVPTAADLSLVLSAPSLDNGGTNGITATATAVDANRNVVSGIPITFKVDSSALAAVTGPVTNASGIVAATISIGSDRSNRLVTVTATSGALTRTASFRVVGASLGATYANLVNASSIGNRIEYRLVDTNTLPMVGQSITVSSPGLPPTAGATDLNGKFTYTYNAPGVAGIVTLTAAAAGDTNVTTVTVQNPGVGTVPPAIGPVAGASLATNPSVVSVNSLGSNNNQAELRALFIGPNNAPIPNVRVRFDLDGNANTTDGVVSWLGGNFAYSDVNGIARGTFTPGQRSSPTNGVALRACYDLVDFPANACPNATRATLTVALEALSVSIRTNDLIKIGDRKLTYIKEYVVMVVDAAGQAKADVLITPSVDLLRYYKGFYQSNGVRWVQRPTLAATEYFSWLVPAAPAPARWERVASTGAAPSCPNDDVNRNGVREATDFLAGVAPPAVSLRGEDLNWNGQLDPRKADVAIKIVGSPKTDANGLAVVQIEYGQDVATWLDFRITVTASGISGSEARAFYTGNLPALADAINSGAVAPAFITSPYGTGSVCTDDQ